MTAITALNVRLGMDASNFSNGVDLARSEVNRVAAIMRQSVPPAEKFKREVELLDKAFNEAGRSTKQYENALDFLMKKYQQGQYSVEVMARARAKEAEQARIAAANLKAQQEAARQQAAREAEAARQAVAAARAREQANRRLQASITALGSEQAQHDAMLRRQGDMLRGARQEAQRATESYNTMAASVGRLAGAYIGFQGARSMVRLASDAEQAAIAFEVMTGSAEAGQKAVDDLRKFAASTPITLRGAQDAAKTLLAFGTSAEKLMPILRTLGDVSAGNQERFQSLALAFGQMSAAGRLMGQDLLQMINAGFNPLQEISRLTGQSIGELKKQMEAGAISSQMVERAFRSATAEGGRFHGMMDRMGTTAAGAYAQLVSSAEETAAMLGRQLLPALAATAKSLENMVRSTGSMISGLDRSQAQVAATVAAFGGVVLIAPRVIAAIGSIVAAIKAMTTAKITALAFTGPKGWAVIAAGAAAAALAVAEVNKLYDQMAESAQAAAQAANEAGGKAKAGAATAAAAMAAQIAPLEREFLKLEHSLNEQVKKLNLGEDAYRRHQLYAKGMSIAQVKRIEQLHEEIRLAERLNKADQERVEMQRKRAEDQRARAKEALQRLERDAGQAIAAARQHFEQQRQQQAAMRDQVSQGPGAGMEVGSAEAVKFMADQANAAIGAAAVPQRPTPGEREILMQAQKELAEAQKQTAEQQRMNRTLIELLTEMRDNGFAGVG